MKSRSFPRYRDEVYLPSRLAPRKPMWHILADIAFWSSVCLTIAGFWVWFAWMFNALEIAR